MWLESRVIKAGNKTLNYVYNLFNEASSVIVTTTNTLYLAYYLNGRKLRAKPL